MDFITAFLVRIDQNVHAEPYLFIALALALGVAATIWALDPLRHTWTTVSIVTETGSLGFRLLEERQKVEISFLLQKNARGRRRIRFILPRDMTPDLAKASRTYQRYLLPWVEGRRDPAPTDDIIRRLKWADGPAAGSAS